MTPGYARVAAWRRRQMYDLRLQFRAECGECGSTDRLEFAHRHGLETLRGSSRGFSEVILDIRNHPLNYRLLCRDCHREYDGILESGAEGPADCEQLEAALAEIGFAPEVRP